ncbi:MAG: radical SAM protein [Methanomassiliicoccales archaeon]|nr:MAG: radical SAM protein [Methanomassiliicoccales archaeon]
MDMWPIRDVRYQVTLACNLSCPHCFAKARQPLPDELSVEEAKEIVLDLKENGMRLLTMTGGEPLCRKDFVLELGSFLSSISARYRVFTNGILLDEELASELKDRGVSEIQVSVDGLEDTHDSFRGMNGAFKRAIRAVRASKQEGIKTAVRLTITQQNHKEVPAIIEYIAGLEIDAFRVRPFVSVGRGSENEKYIPTPEAMIEAFSHIEEKRKNLPFPFQLITPSFHFLGKDPPKTRSEKSFVGSRCVCGKQLCAITPDGWLKPCGYFSVKLGNLREQKFAEIWNNNAFLDKMRSIDRLSDVCMNCKYLVYCGGGCRASAYENTGDLCATDPLCPLVR